MCTTYSIKIIDIQTSTTQYIQCMYVTIYVCSVVYSGEKIILYCTNPGRVEITLSASLRLLTYRSVLQSVYVTRCFQYI